MKSLLYIVNESKEMKDKKIMSFKEFDKIFYDQEPIDLSKYWNMEIEIEIKDLDNLFLNRWYVKYGDRKHNFDFSFLGKKQKTIKLKNRGNGTITQYSNGIYVEIEKHWVIIGEKNIIKDI